MVCYNDNMRNPSLCCSCHIYCCFMSDRSLNVYCCPVDLTVIETNRFLRCVQEKLQLQVAAPTTQPIFRPLPTSSLPVATPPTHPPPTSSLPTQFPPMNPPAREEIDDLPRGQTLVSKEVSFQSTNVFGAPPLNSNSEAKAMSVRYILCSQLFAQELRERSVLKLDPASYTMKDLVSHIARAEKILEGQCLELYTHEGYPLGVNEYTAKCE